MSGNQKTNFKKSIQILATGILAIFLFITTVNPAQAQLAVVDAPGDASLVSIIQILMEGLGQIWAQLSGSPVTIFGDPVVPYDVQPTPGTIDADVVNGFAGVNAALAALNEGVGRAGQIGSDATKAYLSQSQVAEDTGKAYISDKSTICALTVGHQARGVMEGFVRAMTGQIRIAGMMMSRGTGPQANETSIGAASERDCEISEFVCPDSNHFGVDIPNNLNCPNKCATGFADADVLPESLTEPKQLIAQNVTVSKTDQHMQIVTNGNADALAYKAAWKLCEHMLELLPPPPHTSGPLTAQYIQMIDRDRFISSIKFGGIRACAAALAYRTACPASGVSFPLNGTSIQNLDPQGGSVTDCHSAQVAACNRLQTAPPNGLGIYPSFNDNDINSALQNCGQNGLSAAMYDYIYAHRCSNTRYVASIMPQNLGGDATQDYQNLESCLNEGKKFDADWYQRSAAMDQRLDAVAERYGYGGGAATSATSSPTQQ